MRRRPFLGLTAAGIALAASSPQVLARASVSTASTRLLLSGDALRALLNQPFHVVDASWRRTLVELVDVIDGPPMPDVEQFTAIFEQAGPGAFAEGIHHLVNDAAGSIDLFLKPLPSTSEEPVRYEASFSLLA